MSEIQKVSIYRVTRRRANTYQIEVKFGLQTVILLEDGAAASTWRIFERLHHFVYGQQYLFVNH
jgi:hypothetical protein